MSFREELHFHLEIYQRNVTVGMRSPKTFPVDVVSKSFSGGDECCAKKLENSAVRYLVGCPLIGHRGRRSRRVVAGLLSEVKRAGAHAPNCSVTDCDGCIERSYRRMETHRTLASRRKTRRLFFELQVTEHRAKRNAHLLFVDIRWRLWCAKGICSVDS